MSAVAELITSVGVLITSLGALAAVFTANQKFAWFGQPKTRRLNTAEHQENAAKLSQAVGYSKAAATLAGQAAAEARKAGATATRVEARLDSYISEHSQLHASLRNR